MVRRADFCVNTWNFYLCRSFCFFFLLLSSFLFFEHGTAYAGEISAFGPKQYDRTTGAPNIYTDTFTAEPGEAMLIIKNGDPGQKSNTDNRVTSGVISLNGVVLFTHDDFKHQTYTLGMPISLLENNTFRVELESKPGTYISIEIIQTVKDPDIDLLASELQIKSEKCPESIDIILQLTNTGETEIPPGVQIAFYNGHPKEGGDWIGTTASTRGLLPDNVEEIIFQWLKPSAGEAIIYARVDDDGIGTGAYEEVDETNNLISVATLLCPVVPPGDNSLSGHIIDAVSGSLLSGVQILLQVDDNGSPGAVVASLESSNEGTFIFSGLAAGSYFISATHAGYIDNQRPITLGENDQLTNQDLVLSPVLGEDEIRIVLTWKDKPADLEAHLTAPNDTGCRYHCYYFNKTIPTANLDLDDRNGYGPETTTITEKVTGTYRYYIHDFTNRYSNSRWLYYSGAQVTVYSGDRDPLVFNVPNSYGNVWHVFDLDGETGEIVPVHKMSNQKEPGRIDYPTIISGAPNRAYWGSPYTYQVRATDPDDDVLTYSLTGAPAGMTIDPTTGLIEWTPSGAQSGWYYTTVKVEDGRCGEVSQTFRVYVYSQPTVQFSVDPCSGFNPGGNITLTWSTGRVSTVLIDQGIGEVATSGSLTIRSPEVPTLYTLTAFNDAALTKRTTPLAPGASFYFSPYYINQGQSTTLHWNSGCSTSRSIDHNIGEVEVSGSTVVTPPATTYYYITAVNGGGTRRTRARINVRIPPDSFTINPRCNFTPGAPLTLSWHINNATDVTISPGIGEVDASGSLVVYPTEAGSYTLTAIVNGNMITRYVTFPDLPTINLSPRNSYGMDLGSSVSLRWSSGCADTVVMNEGHGDVGTSGNLMVTPGSLPRTYTVTATNERGSASRSVRLYQVLPTVSLNPYSSYGMDLGDSVTLNWSTSYADTVNMDQGVGVVDPIGSLPVTPESLPVTYRVTAENEAGVASRSVRLYQIAPRGTITADPTVLKVGNSTTLTLTSSRATNCTITPDIGEVECNGTLVVTPNKPTYYYFNMVGPGGTYRRWVYVGFVTPVADLKASIQTVREGESTELTWVFANATSCVIDQGIGEVELGGEVTVSPTTTTTYTMTATGPGGTVTDRVTITVIPANPPPAVSLSVNDRIIMRGDSADLSWQSSYADSLEITPDIGAVSTTGTTTVSPEVTTTYTATAIGAGGTTTAKITVTVLQPSPTMTIIAEPISIVAGGSAVLSWSSSDADRIVFNQGIGSETLQGSLTVSPNTTTTYTATATGPGGTTTKSVTVIVTYLPPTVSFTASPLSIQLGESVALSWSTSNVGNVTIDQGIGSVALQGSLTVSPDITTTYTVTATGSGGTATKSVTVTVTYLSPTVSFVANPLSIKLGESVALSWSTTNAENVTIDQGIGTVDSTGTLLIYPGADITYTITAAGPGGTVTAQTAVTVTVSPLSLTITSPNDGDSVSRPDIMVTGTITHAGGSETGVVVNGVVALVYDGRFVANHVPLAVGENSVTVTATDAEGNSRQESVIVYAAPGAGYISLISNYASGLATLDATLQVLSTFSPVGAPVFSAIGPEEIVYSETDTVNSIDISMEMVGLYFLTATVQSENGEFYKDEIAILLIDREKLDALLQAKWGGLKQALITGNTQEAIAFHHPSVRDDYEAIYVSLGDRLPALVGQMQEIDFIFAEGSRAKYRIRKAQIIDGNLETITYYIYFYFDEKGIWRLENY